MRRVEVAELCERIGHVLLGLGMTPERAALCARLIAETDRDGVHTHGIARLPRFAEMVKLGRIDISATPKCTAAFGVLERWDGHRGPGNLAAYAAMQRAMELARGNGVGAVALGNTSHWMRGGSYGWQAAEAGFAAMCWTNTLPNLPPWGATSPALGNNPLVIAIPRSTATGEAAPIVLDIAMSQFSYGTLAAYRGKDTELPVPGGFDEAGVLTRNAAVIERTQRALPIGFWKGSGLAFVLDVLAAMLAGGRATHEFSDNPLDEVGQSQVFVAISPESVTTVDEMNRVAQGAIDALHEATPVEAGGGVRYPGEGALRVREESLRLGVLVEESAWEKVCELGEELAR